MEEKTITINLTRKTLTTLLILISAITCLTVVAASDVPDVVAGTETRVYITVLNSTGGAETSATCTTDVWWPNKTLALDDYAMTHEGGARYYLLTPTSFTVEGRYLGEATCTSSEGVGTQAYEFKVVSADVDQSIKNILEYTDGDGVGGIDADIGNPSASGTTLYTYLVNTIYDYLVNTIKAVLGTPNDYGYNNISAMVNTALEYMQSKVITVAGTVTDNNGNPVSNAEVDIYVYACTQIGTCDSTPLGALEEISVTNGKYVHQFQRDLVPGRIYKINTTIYYDNNVVTTYSYFNN